MNLSIQIQLPDWLAALTREQAGRQFNSREDKMRFVIDLSRRNVAARTGGPFGAAIFDEQVGALISCAVNAVVTQNQSIAHAETLAIMLAQQKLKTFDLASDKDREYALYTSGQPCIMCFGATWWSGVTHLVCAARTEDIEELTGFREGPLPADWAGQLEGREELPKIDVISDVLRDEACEVLRAYAESGQPVYNAGAGGSF